MSTGGLFEIDQSGFFKNDRKAVQEEDEADFDVTEGDSEIEWSITSENTLFVIDWDDTLLATSWLARKQINLETPLIPEKESADLEVLDAAICSFLRKIIVLYGKVLIVTNAQQGWVELSAKKFLPETYDLIFQPSSASSCCSFSSSSSGFHNDPDSAEGLNFSADYVNSDKSHNNGSSKRFKVDWESKIEDFDPSPFEPASSSKSNDVITVVSARYLFEREFPTDPSAWKRKAFQKLLKTRIASKFFIEPEDSMQFDDDHFPLEPDFDEKLEKDFSITQQKDFSTDDFDLNNLVEVAGESFEVETDFNETDSFFSIDFRPSSIADEDAIEEEFASDDIEMDFQTSPSEDQTSTQGEGSPKIVKEACNLISMGDCIHDCESLRKLNLDLKNTFKKTIKMAEFPNISQLTKELNEMEIYLDSITKAKQDFDLVVDRSYLA